MLYERKSLVISKNKNWITRWIKATTKFNLVLEKKERKDKLQVTDGRLLTTKIVKC